MPTGVGLKNDGSYMLARWGGKQLVDTKQGRVILLCGYLTMGWIYYGYIRVAGYAAGFGDE